MLKNAPCQEPFVHHTVLAKQAMIFPAINTQHTFQVLGILPSTYIQPLAQTQVREFHSRHRLCCKAAATSEWLLCIFSTKRQTANTRLKTRLAASNTALRYPAAPAVHIQHQVTGRQPNTSLKAHAKQQLTRTVHTALPCSACGTQSAQSGRQPTLACKHAWGQSSPVQTDAQKMSRAQSHTRGRAETGPKPEPSHAKIA